MMCLNARTLLVAAVSLALAPAATATTIVYSANLIGSSEVPPNGSAAFGSIIVTLDDVANTLSVSETFSNLSANATGAHIHCCATAGSNAAVAVPFTTFPSTTSGTFDFTFDLLQVGTYTAAFVAASGGTPMSSRDALLNGLAAGEAYANIHNSIFPGGEIRGQLSAVPEPASWVLMLGGFGLIGSAMRNRRRPAVSFG